jgi:hypothetical protein
MRNKNKRRSGPPQTRQTKTEQEEQYEKVLERTRELQTLSCLWGLMADAKQRMDIAAWRNAGGLEVEDFIDCIERGLPDHPLIRSFQRRMADNANRPAPSIGDLRVRRQVIRCCAALERNGIEKLGKGEALAFTVRRLAPTFHGQGPSGDAIRRWQKAQPLGCEDDVVINKAIERAGGDKARIVEYFAGLIIFARDPTVQAVRR